MVETATLTVTVNRETKDRLESLARDTNRSESLLAEQAISSFLEIQAWQVEKIKKSIAEADANPGKGIPHEKVVKWLRSWGTPNELPPPECE